MSGMDRVRAVLDQLAEDTKPGESDYMSTYDSMESAIDAISRIAYPEDKP